MTLIKSTCFLIVGACLLSCCATTDGQTKSTVSEFDKSKRQRAPFKLAQQTDKPGKSPQQITPSANAKQAIEKKPLPPVSKKRRDQLMKFIGQHHAELKPLLISLEKNRPDKFQSTMRTLDRDEKNLKTLKDRAPARYEKSLEQWIVRSKIRLLSAQLVLKNSDKQETTIKKELTSLVARQHDLKVAQVADDLAQTQQRLDKLSTQLTTLTTNRNEAIQTQLNAINKNATRILTAQKKAAEAKKKQAKTKKQPTDPKKNSKQDDKNNPKDK